MNALTPQLAQSERTAAPTADGAFCVDESPAPTRQRAATVCQARHKQPQLLAHRVSPRSVRRPLQPAQRARGFALVAAIFLLVVIGGLVAFAVTLSANAAATSAVAVQGARAYEAARAGIEWAAFQVRDPNNTLAPGATNLPNCFASPTTLTLPAAMGDFTVQLDCTRHPSFSASPSFHEEGDKRSAYYLVISTASAGVVGSTDYVERRLEARIEKCKDPTAAGPAYVC